MRTPFPFFRARRGVNLIEVLVAASVAGTVMLALGGFITSTFRASNSDRDKTFAMQKALQMMEEMAAYQSKSSLDSIDQFSAEGYKHKLTIDPAPIKDALSGNVTFDGSASGYYKFVREIKVTPVEGDPYARRVTVKVFKAKKQATPLPENTNEPLAVVTNVLRSTQAAMGPRQVIDVYAISIENLPHVYRKDDNHQFFPSTKDARREFEAAVAEFEGQNSSIDLQIHYISRLSEGRDKLYRPYINKGKSLTNAPSSSARDPLNKLYFYPGTIGQGADTDPYYDPDGINGRIAVGDASAVGQNTHASAYAMADQFNHAVRYHDEFTPVAANTETFMAPKFPADRSGATVSDLSLRQFLEALVGGDATKDETNFRNAVVVNLHGDLFPMIPLRNYGDPAKDPSADNTSKRSERRLVTHPYRLVTPYSQPVRLLVHPYMANGLKTPNSDTSGDRDVKIDWPMTDHATSAKIVIKGLKPYLAANTVVDLVTPLTVDANDVKIELVQREKHDGSPQRKSGYRRFQAWPSGSCVNFKHTGPHIKPHDTTGDHHAVNGSTAAHGYNPQFQGDDFVIFVQDLDYDARSCDDTDGSGPYYGIKEPSGVVDSDYLLHRLQYFPDPFLPFLDVANATNYPRNTARIITEFYVTAAAAGKSFEVDTILETPSGWPADGEPAFAKTRFYVEGLTSSYNATKKLYWNSGTNSPTIPWTEQGQLMGDPRHNPYQDVRSYGMYNPYFSNFKHKTGTTGFTTENSLYFKDNVTNDTSDANQCLDAINQLVPSAERPPVVATTKYDVEFPGTEDEWHGTKLNVPEYMRMWRHAIMRNNLVFVNMGGEPARFVGMGGEFELNDFVNDIGDIDPADLPWDITPDADAAADAEELFGGKLRLLERQSGDLWYAKPWIGELYPSDKWSQWNTKGNLDAGSDLQREALGSIDKWSWATDKTDAKNKARIDDTMGLATFLNAEDTAGSGPIEFEETGSKAALTSTGKTATGALRQKLPLGVKADWGYKLNGTATADLPFHWAKAPYSGERLLMNWLDGTQSPTGYYNQDGVSGAFAAAPILLEDSGTTSTSRKGIVVPVTLRPDKAEDMINIMKIGLTSAVAAYLDGTNTALTTNHVRPTTRVKITEPKQDETLPNSYTLKWYCRPAKVDGSEYSPFYTFNTSSTPTIVHYLKFKGPDGIWRNRLGAIATPGEPDAVGLQIASQSYPNPITYSWNNSTLTAGDYTLRIEAFRKIGTTVDWTHHAYHELKVKLD